MEIWKDIQGYEGLYQVSNLGRVKSLARIAKGRNDSERQIGGRFRSTNNLMANGYKMVSLSKDKTLNNFLVHRLVAEAFCDKRNSDAVVNHIDGNKQNNSASNLEWCSRSYNQIHAFKVLGVKPSNPWSGVCSKDHPRSKPIIMKKDGSVIREFHSAVDAEKETGISRKNILHCLKGKHMSAGGYNWSYKIK